MRNIQVDSPNGRLSRYWTSVLPLLQPSILI